jgi:hypothetical protein
MKALPSVNGSLLVRTDFSEGSSWHSLVEEVMRETEDGFRAYVEVIDDSEFDGAEWADVKRNLPANDEGGAVLFVADTTALRTTGFPILVVYVFDDREPFRCVVTELWNVDNNLNLANMDWEDFADSVDANGVFRGFGSD